MESSFGSSVTLRPEVAERATALAAQRDCSVAELIEYSIQWYDDVDRLMAAIQSGDDRTDAFEQLVQDYVDRTIHEYRAERRAEARAKSEGERKAS
jgi:hypothetical protein